MEFNSAFKGLTYCDWICLMVGRKVYISYTEI